MTNNGSFGAGFASGFILSMMISEEDSKKKVKKLKKMQYLDQILVKTKKKKEDILRNVAKIRDNIKYEDGILYTKPNIFTLLSDFIHCVIVIGFILFVVGFVLLFGFRISFDIKFWIFLLMTMSFFATKCTADKEVDWVKVKDFGNYRLVTIKRFDDEGNRILDEDEIAELIKVIIGR